MDSFLQVIKPREVLHNKHLLFTLTSSIMFMFFSSPYVYRHTSNFLSLVYGSVLTSKHEFFIIIIEMFLNCLYFKI